MSSNYIFSLTPTFTQGLVIGQLSILALLYLVLKYLFLDSRPSGIALDSDQPSVPFEKDYSARTRPLVSTLPFAVTPDEDGDSTAWFNLILQQIIESYRAKLRNDLQGPEGDEIARRRVERFANTIRPQSFVDPVRIHAVDLGTVAPKITRAKIKESKAKTDGTKHAAFEIMYTDTVSVSLSTSALFHHPVPFFVRLPVTLNVSLSLFAATLLVTPPDPLSPHPTLTVSLMPDFALELNTTSLLGSRAKLSDVPKLHELIQAQVRRVLTERGTWKVVLPLLSTVEEVQEDVARQRDSIDSARDNHD